ncbi:hypothetical protein [Anabaena sp. PCC 7108]|uniref:DUF7210 family protein n=1 Tax=Anabaena sp. PCC 7108 TaxID=163908 RepID=UPI000346BE2A|nr:hypothetical protein [Anabaena sp. PCC 7108]
MEAIKYKVLDLLNHGGKQYQPGDEVELTEQEAAPLVSLNVVEPLPVEEKALKK